jgi:oligo-1,6-glucosidase
MDVINMISKDPALPDGLVRSGLWGDGTPFFVGGPRLHEYLQEMHREVFADRDGQFLTVGEMPFVTVEQARLFTDPARAELDMVFQFEHVWLDRGASKWDVQPLRLRDLKATLGRWQAGLAEVGWNSLYWNNHDQPRSVSRFGDDRNYRVLSAKLLATVLHLHRGTPYVYQGDEIGMTNAPFASVDDFDDIESRNHYTAAVAAGEDPETVLEAMRHMSRDNARTPMQWDDSPNAGFTTGTPWLPVNLNYRQINVADAVDDPNSIFHYFRRVIALRHADPVVAYGDFTMLIPDDELVYAYTRDLDGVSLLVVANFSDTTVRADVPERGAWAASELVLANYPVDAGADLELRPWECRVYRRTGAAPGR